MDVRIVVNLYVCGDKNKNKCAFECVTHIMDVEGHGSINMFMALIKTSMQLDIQWLTTSKNEKVYSLNLLAIKFEMYKQFDLKSSNCRPTSYEFCENVEIVAISWKMWYFVNKKLLN